MKIMFIGNPFLADGLNDICKDLACTNVQCDSLACVSVTCTNKSTTTGLDDSDEDD